MPNSSTGTGLSDHERKRGRPRGPKRDYGPPDALTPATIKETAQLLRVNVKTVQTAIADGEIPAIRVRGVLLVPRPWLTRLLTQGSGNEAA
jgi:excisionase family DNA binding protein